VKRLEVIPFHCHNMAQKLLYMYCTKMEGLVNSTSMCVHDTKFFQPDICLVGSLSGPQTIDPYKHRHACLLWLKLHAWLMPYTNINTPNYSHTLQWGKHVSYESCLQKWNWKMAATSWAKITI